MYKFIDHYYGADADGNRSMPLISYVIEPSDTEQIQRQIMEYMNNSGKLPANPFTISLIEPVSEEQVELSINPFEYITKEDCKDYLTLFGSDQ